MISICLSTFNGSQFIEELLDSLEKQTYQDWQLLVRDDGSSDTTLQTLKKFKDLYPQKVFLNQDNEGNLGSRKSFMKLLEYTETPYIMLCDQDDVWTSEKIEISLNKIQEMERIYGTDMPLAVFTDMRVVDDSLNVMHESFWSYQKLDPGIAHDWKKLLAQNVITGCTIIMNRAAKGVSLPFGLKTMMHDHWIGVNVSKYGKVGYLDRPTVLYRQHGENVEGAHQYGWHYVLRKLKNIDKPMRQLYKSAVYFDVSFVLLLIYKFTISIQRLLKR